MSTRTQASFARIATVAAVCVLAASCGRRDDAGTAAGGGAADSATPPVATTTPGGNPTTGMPKGVGPAGPGTATTTGADGAAAVTLNEAERKFVADAAAGGMYEVQASQLAASKASDPKVKAYGEKLAQDHGKSNDELKSFASSHAVTLPTDLPADKKADLDKLSKASGAEFDKQYVKMIGMDDHEKDIAKFEQASKDAKNPELKAWIDKTLPTLKEHHAMARQLPGAGSS